MDLIGKLAQALAEIDFELAELLDRVLANLSERLPLVLDRALQLVQPIRRVFVRTRFDSVPVREPLLEETVLTLLPQVDGQAQPIDLRLQLRQTSLEFGGVLMVGHY